MKRDKTKICTDCGGVIKDGCVKSPFKSPKKVIECCNCGFKRVLS